MDSLVIEGLYLRIDDQIMCIMERLDDEYDDGLDYEDELVIILR